MKHIKLFEKFEKEEYKGLPSEQEEELREIFWEFVTLKDLSKEEAEKYFDPKSQTFADFLIKLENETDWFDYTQMNDIFQELSIYISEMDEDNLEWVDENKNSN
jgi:hypothetical protein